MGEGEPGMNKIIVRENRNKQADHNPAWYNNKGIGFEGKKHPERGIALERCPECGLENYAAAVLSGICAWCGWSVEGIEVTHENS